MPNFTVDAKGNATLMQKTEGLVEKDHQTFFENNMDTVLRLKFLKSEYSTGKMHGGRIDTLAVDESVPIIVIIEYKNRRDINVLIQGFYYFGWVRDHPKEVIDYAKSQGVENADKIDVKKTRIICVSPKFSKEELYTAATWNAWFKIDIQLLTFEKTGNIVNVESATHPSIPMCLSNGSARPVRRSKTKGKVSTEEELIDTDTVVTSPVKALVTRLKNPEWVHHKLFKMIADYTLSFDKVEMHENTEYIGFRKLFNLFVLRGYAKYMKMVFDLSKTKDDVVIELLRRHFKSYPKDQLIQTDSKYKKDAITTELIIKCPEDLPLVFPIVEILCENN